MLNIFFTSFVFEATIIDKDFANKYHVPTDRIALKIYFNLNVNELNMIEELKECTSLCIVKYYFGQTFDNSRNSKNVISGEVNEMVNKMIGPKSILAIGMEYLSGPNFEELKIQDYKLTLKYILDIAAALEWLHSRNIMHRNISPKNIMLNKTRDYVISIKILNLPIIG